MNKKIPHRVVNEGESTTASSTWTKPRRDFLVQLGVVGISMVLSRSPLLGLSHQVGLDAWDDVVEEKLMV